MRPPFWTLNKLISLTILCGFAVLMVEIRAMHQDVLGDYKVAWTPLVYSGLMVAGGVIALIFWDRGGRIALLCGFALGLVVGPTGYWFHNQGHLIAGFTGELSAWTKPVVGSADRPKAGAAPADKPPDAGDNAAPGPPALAPLTFAGLGLIGVLSCARRFQPDSAGAERGETTRAGTIPGNRS